MAWITPIIVAEQQREQENQLLAALMAQDQEGHYEYKILHGGLGAFRKPENLNAVLEEEARAQWQLVLKLDNERIVLRRPRTAQSRDVLLGEGVDPYRTTLGGRTSGRYVVMGLLLLTLTIGIGIAFLASDGLGGLAASGIMWSVLLIGVVVLILIGLMIVFRR